MAGVPFLKPPLQLRRAGTRLVRLADVRQIIRILVEVRVLPLFQPEVPIVQDRLVKRLLARRRSRLPLHTFQQSILDGMEPYAIGLDLGLGAAAEACTIAPCWDDRLRAVSQIGRLVARIIHLTGGGIKSGALLLVALPIGQVTQIVAERIAYRVAFGVVGGNPAGLLQIRVHVRGKDQHAGRFFDAATGQPQEPKKARGEAWLQSTQTFPPPSEIGRHRKL